MQIEGIQGSLSMQDLRQTFNSIKNQTIDYNNKNEIWDEYTKKSVFKKPDEKIILQKSGHQKKSLNGLNKKLPKFVTKSQDLSTRTIKNKLGQPNDELSRQRLELPVAYELSTYEKMAEKIAPLDFDRKLHPLNLTRFTDFMKDIQPKQQQEESKKQEEPLIDLQKTKQLSDLNEMVESQQNFNQTNRSQQLQSLQDKDKDNNENEDFQFVGDDKLYQILSLYPKLKIEDLQRLINDNFLFFAHIFGYCECHTSGGLKLCLYAVAGCRTLKYRGIYEQKYRHDYQDTLKESKSLNNLQILKSARLVAGGDLNGNVQQREQMDKSYQTTHKFFNQNHGQQEKTQILTQKDSYPILQTGQPSNVFKSHMKTFYPKYDQNESVKFGLFHPVEYFKYIPGETLKLRGQTTYQRQHPYRYQAQNQMIIPKNLPTFPDTYPQKFMSSTSAQFRNWGLQPKQQQNHPETYCYDKQKLPDQFTTTNRLFQNSNQSIQKPMKKFSDRKAKQHLFTRMKLFLENIQQKENVEQNKENEDLFSKNEEISVQ